MYPTQGPTQARMLHWRLSPLIVTDPNLIIWSLELNMIYIVRGNNHSNASTYNKHRCASSCCETVSEVAVTLAQFWPADKTEQCSPGKIRDRNGESERYEVRSVQRRSVSMRAYKIMSCCEVRIAIHLQCITEEIGYIVRGETPWSSRN